MAMIITASLCVVFYEVHCDGGAELQLAGQCQRSIRVSASKPFQALPRVSQITQHNIYTGSPRVKTDSTLSAGAGDKAISRVSEKALGVAS